MNHGYHFSLYWAASLIFWIWVLIIFCCRASYIIDDEPTPGLFLSYKVRFVGSPLMSFSDELTIYVNVLRLRVFPIDPSLLAGLPSSAAFSWVFLTRRGVFEAVEETRGVGEVETLDKCFDRPTGVNSEYFYISLAAFFRLMLSWGKDLVGVSSAVFRSVDFDGRVSRSGLDLPCYPSLNWLCYRLK